MVDAIPVDAGARLGLLGRRQRLTRDGIGP